MEFNLEVHLKIGETGISSVWRFSARGKREIPEVAFQFIQRLKRETGYRTTFIEKVMVNGTEDITEKVKEIENRPIPAMDDTFW